MGLAKQQYSLLFWKNALRFDTPHGYPIWWILQSQCGPDSGVREIKSGRGLSLDSSTVEARPIYLQRELSAVIVTVIYIPPQDKKNNKLPLNELYKAINKQEDILILVANVFNSATSTFYSWAPKWRSGLMHCISVQDVLLQSLIWIQTVSHLAVIGSPIVRCTVGPVWLG
jgi:hypothetical protein